LIILIALKVKIQYIMLFVEETIYIYGNRYTAASKQNSFQDESPMTWEHASRKELEKEKKVEYERRPRQCDK